MPEKIEITVLLPCYNEEEALPSVVRDIRNALDSTKYSYEILVVDDGSTDQSVLVAQELSCRLIKHEKRQGAGASRKTGTLGAKGDVIVMLDADGTYTASDIPKMLSYFPAYDQVNGLRNSEKGTLIFLRIPAKWFIRQLASLLVNYPIPDLNTGLKAFKREIMLRYLSVVPDGFSCVSSMTLAFLCNGHSVKYIPTQYCERIGKSKFHPVKDALKAVMTIVRVVFYFRPASVYLLVILCLLIICFLKFIVF